MCDLSRAVERGTIASCLKAPYHAYKPNGIDFFFYTHISLERHIYFFTITPVSHLAFLFPSSHPPLMICFILFLPRYINLHFSKFHFVVFRPILPIFLVLCDSRSKRSICNSFSQYDILYNLSLLKLLIKFFFLLKGHIIKRKGQTHLNKL